MDWIKKNLGDICFFFAALAYIFYGRKPEGGTFQTAVDILMVVAFIMIAIKHVLDLRHNK